MYSGLAAGYNTIQANFDPEKEALQKLQKETKEHLVIILQRLVFGMEKKPQ